MNLIEQGNKPTIAAINGVALGKIFVKILKVEDQRSQWRVMQEQQQKMQHQDYQVKKK